jgi:GT2 family glycosyltransferase
VPASLLNSQQRHIQLKITAIIPTKNRVADLLKAVDSVCTQEYLPNELIVVDQSSTEAGRELVVAMMENMGSNKINLIYIYDPEITGLVDAKRVGVSRSSGDMICFLEDDIILEPDYFKAMANAFHNDPKMMGCCGVVTNLPDLSVHYVRIFHLFHRGIFHDPRVGVHGYTGDELQELIPSNYLSGGTSAYRREVFDKVPFDLANGFFMLEDIDFSTRAVREFGAENFFINTSARLRHMMSPVNRAQLALRYRRKLKEFICFYKKNRRHKYAFISLLWLLCGLALESVLVAISHRSWNPIKGLSIGVMDGIRWKVNKA